jgi:hypothetical protein
MNLLSLSFVLQKIIECLSMIASGVNFIVKNKPNFFILPHKLGIAYAPDVSDTHGAVRMFYDMSVANQWMNSFEMIHLY